MFLALLLVTVVVALGYLGPTLTGKDLQAAGLSVDRWVMEIYRTAVESLQGIAWLLLVFFVFALMAYVIVRLGEMRTEKTSSVKAPDSKE